jgi:FixJ family two-component response regulator
MLLFARRERPATRQDPRHHSGSAREPNDKSNVPSESQPRPIVFIVDDDVSVRESLELLIQDAGWQPETFASATSFLRRPRAQVPSCLLLDVSLPDLNGLELQQRIAEDRADMPIIFITGHGDVPMTVRAMKAGAVEFLTKPLDDDALLGAISHALDQSRAALGHAAGIREIRERYESLSRREREVMALVVSGLLNKQVGGQLHISEITVKAHRGKVMRKMKADSLADLVNMAASLQLPPVREA